MEFCDTAEEWQVCVSYDGGSDASGVISGVGGFTFTGTVEGELVGPISGQMKGSAEKTKVALEGPFEGD